MLQKKEIGMGLSKLCLPVIGYRVFTIFTLRYDGIYKVLKYYPEKGESGFIVWRFLLRRDDPTPAPWTKEGKKRIESLGLTMIVSINLLN